MSDALSLLDDDEEPSAPFWMATFSDMMTLLLTFFVMLVAMSSVEVKKFEEALSYFTGRRGVMEQEGLMPGIMGVAGESDVRDQARQFEDIARAVQERGLGAAVDLDLTERGVRVTFVDSVAFAPGSVVLDEPARGVLETVAEMATGVATVEVEGHTDDQPHLDGGLPVQLGALGRPRGGRRALPGRPPRRPAPGPLRRLRPRRAPAARLQRHARGPRPQPPDLGPLPHPRPRRPPPPRRGRGLPVPPAPCPLTPPPRRPRPSPAS